MSTISLSESQMKDLVKQAVVELLEERRDLFYDLFAEVIEDAALVNAIREEGTNYSVYREDTVPPQ